MFLFLISLSNLGLRKIPSRRLSEVKILDIINRLWNVCCQMEVGAFLTCGSGIKVVNVGIIFNKQGIIQIGSAATTAAPFAAFGNSDTFPDMYSTCPRVRNRRLEWSWEKQLRTS